MLPLLPLPLLPVPLQIVLRIVYGVGGFVAGFLGRLVGMRLGGPAASLGCYLAELFART